MVKIKSRKSNSVFFSNFLGAMIDLVRVVDKNSIVIYENEAFKNTLGETISKKCYKDKWLDSFRIKCPYFQGFNSKNETQYSGEIIIDNRTYSLIVSRLHDGGVVEVFRDITNENTIIEKIIGSNKKMVKELDLAKNLQLSILRDNMPDIKGYQFSSVFLPCETLGGDMYDCFKISDDKVAMYIADVSGHGVMSAMLTVYLRQEIFSQFKSHKNIKDVLKGLNESFIDLNIESSVYITVFMIVLDINTGEFVFSNAGHSVAPIIFNGKETSEIFSPGTPISSWFENPDFFVENGKLEKGGKILLFTDGLDKIHLDNKTVIGLRRLLFNKKVLGDRLLDKIINKYANKKEDDITLLLAERE